jgi:DNA-directed RNA polymerase subunit H (RpoH/RPB5)
MKFKKTQDLLKKHTLGIGLNSNEIKELTKELGIKEKDLPLEMRGGLLSVYWRKTNGE